MVDHVRLVFAGEVLEGFATPVVKQKLGQWLKLEPAKLDAMFTGKRVVLKRSIPHEDAAHWVARFNRIGAQLEVEPLEAEAEAAPPSRPAAPPAPPPPVATRPPVADAGPATTFPHTEAMEWPAAASPALPAAAASRGADGHADFAATRPMEWPSNAGSGGRAAPQSSLFFGQAQAGGNPPAAPPPPWATPAPVMSTPWLTTNDEPLALEGLDSAFVTPLPEPARTTPVEPPLNLTLMAMESAVTCPNCGETQPRAVLCRHCATDIERAIAAREEERVAERARRQAEARARRGLPPIGSGSYPRGQGSLLSDDDAASLFSLRLSGRLGRMSYLAGNLVFWSGLCVLLLMAVLMPGAFSFIVLGLGTLLLVLWSARLTVLRLHDLNRSGWWSLLLGVPTLGTLASLILMLIPGDADANDYGDPVPERHAWLAIASVVVISLCVSTGWKAAKTAFQRYQGKVVEEQEKQAKDAAVTPREKLQTFLGSADAANAFLNTYANSPGHRAFASAPAGAWGMRSGAGSRDQAALDALSDCKRRLEDGGGICQLVHLDTEWVVDPNR